MSDHSHRRDDERDERNHERENEGLPDWAIITIAFIQRLGFPIFVCCCLMAFIWIQQREMIKAINDFKDVMVSVKYSIDAQTHVLKLHSD